MRARIPFKATKRLQRPIIALLHAPACSCVNECRAHFKKNEHYKEKEIWRRFSGKVCSSLEAIRELG